jgi:hypothetical protein
MTDPILFSSHLSSLNTGLFEIIPFSFIISPASPSSDPSPTIHPSRIKPKELSQSGKPKELILSLTLSSVNNAFLLRFHFHIQSIFNINIQWFGVTSAKSYDK